MKESLHPCYWGGGDFGSRRSQEESKEKVSGKAAARGKEIDLKREVGSERRFGDSHLSRNSFI